MAKHDDSARTLENVATLMQYTGMSVEEGRELFASCTGYYPHTGKRYKPKKWRGTVRRWFTSG